MIMIVSPKPPGMEARAGATEAQQKTTSSRGIDLDLWLRYIRAGGGTFLTVVFLVALCASQVSDTKVNEYM